jgi:hypothetical protein
MAINSISPGSYNSPSVQPQAQTQRTPEKPREVRAEVRTPPPPVEQSMPSMNTSGQTVGTMINTKA